MNIFTNLLMATKKPAASGDQAYKNDPYLANVSLLVQGNSFIDDSNYHAILTNNATTITIPGSKWGFGSLDFNGTTARITTPSADQTNLGTGDFTIEAWVYSRRGTSYFEQAFGKGNGNEVGSYAFALYNGAFSLYYDGGAVISSSTAFVISTWYHVAYVRRSGVVTIFVNGINQASRAMTSNLTNSTIFALGDRRAGDPSLQYPFSGKLEQVRITKGIGRYVANFTPSLTTFSS